MRVKILLRDFEEAARLLAAAAFCPTPNAGGQYWGHSSKLIRKDGEEVGGLTPISMAAMLLSSPDEFRVKGTVLSSSIVLYHKTLTEEAGDLFGDWVVEFSGSRGSIRDCWLGTGGYPVRPVPAHQVLFYESSQPTWFWWENRDEALTRLALSEASASVYADLPLERANEIVSQLARLSREGDAEGVKFPNPASQPDDADERVAQHAMLVTAMAKRLLERQAA